MTETRLRTLASFSAYVLSALFMAALALQNLRFGFYSLFYLATLLTVVTAAGAVYTLAVHSTQLRARWHGAFAIACLLLTLTPALTGHPGAALYWQMPVLILTALTLPLRRAMALILPFTLVQAVLILMSQAPLSALTDIIALALVATGALLTSWHYDHMAQSAEDLAITDPVTGAHNARFLNETLQKEISRSRHSGHPLSLIVLGIDHHEQIAELLEHERLHQLYRHLSDYLFGVIRAGDTLYYMGQGQFCLILPFTPEEGARVSAERIRRSIAEHQWPEVSRMTVSLGVTTFASGDTLADALRQRASDALLEAARRGPDSCWFQHASTSPA